MADMMHDVVFEDVVVAGHADGHVRRVVDEIVARDILYPVEGDGVGIGEPVDGERADVVVFNDVPRRHEILAVARIGGDATRSHVMDVAGMDGVLPSADDGDSVEMEVADGAAFDANATAVCNLHAAHAFFEDDPLEDHV